MTTTGTTSKTRTLLQIITIAVIGFLIYSNTLTAAFQFDDKLNIVEDQLIRNLGNFWPPRGSRWFGQLTFALNYLVGGLNPFGYHLTNTCIHILTALTFYTLILLTFKTPFFKRYRGTVVSPGTFAFICALLFVTHPIQTQAVTYIVQRFAALAALLFVSSLNLYILARLSFNQTDSNGFTLQLKRGILLAGSAGLALLSFRTKENAFTLPLVIALYEVMFIYGLSRLASVIRSKWRLTALLLAGTATAVLMAVFTYSAQLTRFFEGLKATREISRHDYLITQFRVIVTYLRLLFWPQNQTIDHDYPVYGNLFSPQILASLGLITALVLLAALLLRVSQKGNPLLALVSFGIAWFFVTLSVESSIIPIIDVMFEHRLYLPSMGAFTAITALSVYALERMAPEKNGWRLIMVALCAGVVLLLSWATYNRNKVWKNEITLWSDVIAKKPKNPRGYNMLGNYYLANFRVYEAIYYFQKTLEADSFYHAARSNLGRAYIMTGRVDEGLKELLFTKDVHRFDAIDTGVLYYNIGHGYFMKGLPDQALANLTVALRYIPNDAGLHHLLGKVYKSKNLAAESEASFRRAHQLEPARY